jgi:hypothetical protein
VGFLQLGKAQSEAGLKELKNRLPGEIKVKKSTHEFIFTSFLCCHKLVLLSFPGTLVPYFSIL